MLSIVARGADKKDNAAPIDQPYSDPDAADRDLVEIANSVEAVRDDGRISIELIDAPFLFEEGNAGAIQHRAQAGHRARLAPLHESGTYVKFTQAGAELFA